MLTGFKSDIDDVWKNKEQQRDINWTHEACYKAM